MLWSRRSIVFGIVAAIASVLIANGCDDRIGIGYVQMHSCTVGCNDWNEGLFKGVLSACLSQVIAL